MPQRLPPIRKTPKKATGHRDLYPSEVTVDGRKMPPDITLRQVSGGEGSVRGRGELHGNVTQGLVLWWGGRGPNDAA